MAKADMADMTITVDAAPAMRAIKRINRNPRRWLYLLIWPLYPIEWALVLLFNLVEVVVNSIQNLILALETHINANTKPGSSGDGTTKVVTKQ